MLISKFDNTNIKEHIAAFEKQNNITLPDEYRRFLLKYNGGMTPKTKFRINKISSDIRAFYGLGKADEHYTFQKLTDNMNILADFIKDDMLPIASTSFGDWITVGLKGDDKGGIFFRYHDRPKKHIKLTDSLVEFMSKCRSEKIGHIRSVEERKQSLIENGFAKNITESIIEIWQAEIDEYSGINQEEFEL